MNSKITRNRHANWEIHPPLRKLSRIVSNLFDKRIHSKFVNWSIADADKATIHQQSGQISAQTLTAWLEPIVRMWRFSKSKDITEGFHTKNGDDV
jgi:hypothetical protein